jgi:RNA polymerase sigma-70 factor (ECF subfamily)
VGGGPSEGPSRGGKRAYVDLADPREFERAYDRHSRRVYASALRVLRDPDRAEDVTQEVFVRLWLDPGRFDPSRGGLGPYLQLMAQSRALDVWRSDQAAARAYEKAAMLAPREPRANEDPAGTAERGGERSLIVRALRRLPQAQREAVVLRYWGGLTLAEIARRVGVPFGTAKGRLRLGLQKLGTELKETSA